MNLLANQFYQDSPKTQPSSRARTAARMKGRAQPPSSSSYYLRTILQLLGNSLLSHRSWLKQSAVWKRAQDKFVFLNLRDEQNCCFIPCPSARKTQYRNEWCFFSGLSQMPESQQDKILSWLCLKPHRISHWVIHSDKLCLWKISNWHTLNIPNMGRTERKSSNCSHLKVWMHDAPPFVQESLKRPSCALSLELPEPLGQGFYPRPHPGKWSSAWGVKHRDVTSVSSTNTRKHAGGSYDVHFQQRLRWSESYAATALVSWEKVWWKAGAAPSWYHFWWYRIKILREGSSEVPHASSSDNYCPEERSQRSVP